MEFISIILALKASDNIYFIIQVMAILVLGVITLLILNMCLEF